MKHFCYILLLVLFISQCRPKEENTITQFSGKPEVPSSIKEEHKYLLDKIYKISLFQDSTGRVAIKLNDLMQHHFKEEEDYVLPPLGLLPLLSTGKLPEQSKEVIVLTEKLKSQLSHMSAEHQLIKAFMDELILVAAKENHPEIIEFEKELYKHANTEEEILFPTSILIGEYLKLKSM
ncbi:MAG: hemerythrin domain-containing protein [Bacteroidia bacterium]|nr:hemerythrin domain-containing protein [Bacteroidia bacterium]